MQQTWRWFGPIDPITIDDLLQIGVEGVVTALYHLTPGTVWPISEIEGLQSAIATRRNGAASGLLWTVVESLPVSEAIKTQTGDYRIHIENYRQSLRNLAACGLQTICYNFMPILDWTRTDLRAPMIHGGTAMRFDLLEFATFDLFILERDGADSDYPADFVDRAAQLFQTMEEAEKTALQNNIVAGLPGANDSWSLADIRSLLKTYQGLSADQLRKHLTDFLAEVVPLAEELSLRLCCHPDDPPFSLLGLPRIMSHEADYAHVVNTVSSPSNGITFCTGSLGVSMDFDGAGFVERLGKHIHFVHLRNTSRTKPAVSPRSSFFEAAHLEGDTDMVSVVNALMREQDIRKEAGRTDWQIPMRPDHGQEILHDINAGGMPGYPMLGRMRGLAELRGIMAAHGSPE